MRRKKVWISACVVMACLCFVRIIYARQKASTPAPVKITFEHMQTQDWGEVQSLGAVGWELVSVTETATIQSGNTIGGNRVYYLKRVSTNR